MRMVAYMERSLYESLQPPDSQTPGPKSGCWFPDKEAPNTVQPANFKKQLPLHIALYSAIYGEIPENKVPKAACGNSWCVRPGHQILKFSGRPYAIPSMREEFMGYVAKNPRLESLLTKP